MEIPLQTEHLDRLPSSPSTSIGVGSLRVLRLRFPDLVGDVSLRSISGVRENQLRPDNNDDIVLRRFGHWRADYHQASKCSLAWLI